MFLLHFLKLLFVIILQHMSNVYYYLNVFQYYFKISRIILDIIQIINKNSLFFSLSFILFFKIKFNYRKLIPDKNLSKYFFQIGSLEFHENVFLNRSKKLSVGAAGGGSSLVFFASIFVSLLTFVDVC
jgi:hypothetical protein